MVLFDHEATVLDAGTTIHLEVAELLPGHKVFEDIDHLGHLAENKTPVLLGMKASHQVCEDFHLGTVCHQSAVVGNLYVRLILYSSVGKQSFSHQWVVTHCL